MTTDAMAVSGTLVPATGSLVPSVPWRDPYTVSPRDLAAYIGSLEERCLAFPESPDIRTCLGIAHAVNHDVDRSMEALEAAIAIEPTHFWSRLKYGELHYRLRALDQAEETTLKAVDLADNPLQLAMARKQLRDIRALNPQRVRLDAPASARGRALFFSALLALAVAVVMSS